MATTTNYGWATPDDTALVKDGASAIRTLGSSIDTTTKALNPETTLGDIVYRSSTANVKTRLGIRSTGQVLQVVAGVPAWGAAPSSSPTFVGCQVYKTGAAQTLTNGTSTSITFDAENFDTDGFHSTSSNTERLTIPTGKAGYYLFYASVMYNGNSAGQRTITLLKNNAGITGAAQNRTSPVNGGYATTTALAVVNLAVADYVSITAYQNSGGDLDIMNDGNTISLYYLGA